MPPTILPARTMDFIETVRYQAPEEIAMKRNAGRWGARHFPILSRILYGMRHSRASHQHLWPKGYGYGGEGDWKVAPNDCYNKAMAGQRPAWHRLLAEDYTYNLRARGHVQPGLPICLKSAVRGRRQGLRVEVHLK